VVAVVAASALAGEVVAMALAIAGLGAWALAIGVAAMTIPLASLGPRLAAPRGWSYVFAMWLASVLLVWPAAFFIVVMVRYWLTGQASGS
jgi:hypothetical protein